MRYCRKLRSPVLLFLALLTTTITWPSATYAQKDRELSVKELKKMSVEELMNLEVTSVSKGPEKLSEVASAIQVIKGEDINRSAATRLPEALRLAPNLQVARSNAHDWAVTARGFNGAPLSNNTLANKLLVMIDGRTVYTPLFGGVFWDVQNVLLEDINRIEVVSGPGGTLWGANAVNGVINVISKTAEETQGLYVSEMAGSFLRDNVGVRYGGKFSPKAFFRVYGQRFDQYSMKRADSSDAHDGWSMTQAGFRTDILPSEKNTITIQGDLYGGKEDTSTTLVNGQNILGRWTHKFSGRSDLTLQLYFDRTYRRLRRANFRDELSTYDLEVQHRFYAGSRNKILWGVGYRMMDDNTTVSSGLFFNPPRRVLRLFSGFAQDQIALIQDRLALTIGTKLLHNDYSGFEIQPSIRMAWTPSTKHTLWGAVSRAVRTPTRFDQDERLPNLATVGNFQSEKVVAYEIGYRARPAAKLSFSLSAFYNTYDDLRTIDTNSTPPPTFTFANNQSATTYGFEVAWNAFIRDWWRVRGGLTYLDKKFTVTKTGVVTGSDLFEAIDPKSQVLLQSVMNLPANFELDIIGRYVDALPRTPVSPAVPAYTTLDARIGWVYRKFTFSVAGQNLAAKYHSEFGSRLLPRSLYQEITLRL